MFVCLDKSCDLAERTLCFAQHLGSEGREGREGGGEGGKKSHCSKVSLDFFNRTLSLFYMITDRCKTCDTEIIFESDESNCSDKKIANNIYYNCGGGIILGIHRKMFKCICR